MFSLKGKIAIITGSSKGIGLGIAKVFVEAGATVVINSRHEEDCKKACKECGENATYICGDVSKEEDVKKLFSETIKKFGKVDIMVNNAGITDLMPIEQITTEKWDKMINVDLRGTFYGCKEAAKAMKKGGKIINLASIAGFIGFPNCAHYCAAKGGIVNMTRELALELAQKGINVNAIGPGIITTEMTEDIIKQQGKQLIQMIPKGRWGKPEDIGYAALYLASDESDYVTGQTLYVDGGWISQ